nr:hypothetical protein [Tanacetum cinerariifolium]
MASDNSDQDARYTLSKEWSNLVTLDEAFSLARAVEAHFTNQQLWEPLRFYPLTLGEAFFRGCITEARDENNQAVDNNIGDPDVKDKQEVKKADDQEIENTKDEEGKIVEDQQVSEADDDTNNDDFGCSLPPHKGVDLTVKEVVFENIKSDLKKDEDGQAPTTLGESFSIARIIEVRFETIAGKKLNIEKINIVLSWPSEEAPLVIKGSLDANEDIGVVEVSSAIDNVFDIGESNVKSMEVRSEFSEFLENKKSVEEVVVGGGEACRVGENELNRVILTLKDGGDELDSRLDEINLNLCEELAKNGVSPIPTSLVAHESSRARQLWERIYSQSAYSSYHLEGKVISEGVGSVTAWVAKGERMVLCYVQGSGRRKGKKGVGCGSGRHENYGSGRRDCGRIRI